MKVTASILAFGAVVLGAAAQEGTFESADFNVTEALIANGFNVAAIPELVELVNADLTKRSLNALQPCAIACKSLSAIYGSTKVLAQGSTPYTTFQSLYWSAQQSAVAPHCVFTPASALEVSSLVLLSRLTQCPFAVKGGSHAAFPGASSIDGGITVSLQNLNQIRVSQDRKTVDIGPGNRWAATYQTLEKSGLAVVGGRMAPVGVPGLILGGGISFFSNKLGWACDNVAAYEVVTASGLIVKATPTQFSDLYWALRGGGNNFGIVTNFKLYAFEQGEMWGGQRVYTENNFAALKDAMFKFGSETSETDRNAAQLISFANFPSIGKVAIAQLHHTTPLLNGDAPIFAPFNALTPIKDSTGIRNLSSLAVLMNEGSTDTGLRQTMWDVTFRLDRSLFDSMTSAFYAAYAENAAYIDGFFPTSSIQIITAGQLAGMARNGGNAIGLDAKKGPFFLLNMSASWKRAVDDERVMQFFADVIAEVKKDAAAKGAESEYIYMNYASEYQAVLGSYGENLGKLRRVSAKYDPDQVFQKLQPGGFKLSGGAPATL